MTENQAEQIVSNLEAIKYSLLVISVFIGFILGTLWSRKF